MANRIDIYGVCLFCAILSSCNLFHKDKSGDTPVAQVYDQILYKKNLAGIGAHAAKKDDSVHAVLKYVESWINHEVVLHQAEENISKEASERIEQQLLDYKESLILYEYEKELIRQKMDTAVSQTEIENYFDKYQDNFELKSSIVQLKYLVIPKDDWKSLPVKPDSVRKWVKAHPLTYTYPLQVFAKKYAVSSAIDDTMWYNLDDLKRVFPADLVPIENWTFTKEYHEVSDSKFVYLLQFNDNRVKGTDAPLSYVNRQIRSIILNKKKITFINGIHKSIYEKAKNDGKIENYVVNKKK